MSYLSLEEAAAKLGISTDRLVELRSQGQVRGFRDGSSWKFPETEISRLADDLADEAELDSEIVPTDSRELLSDEGDFESEMDNLMEIDSAELKLDDPAVLSAMDNDSVDIAIDPKEGSTGPVAKAEIEEAVAENSVSSVEIGEEPPASGSGSASGDLAFDSLSEEDSDDLMIGDESEDSLDLDALVGDESGIKSAGASSLELMNELETPSAEEVMKSSGGDVLSELDLLGEEKAGGSGLISGDSENLLTSSGLGSGLGSSVLGEMDDALDEDDDLVIADDDAELMLDSVSDISVAGDSGINLMSPSDSGLSLESEPLDLAGSSLSALDLGAELTDGSGVGSGSGSGSGSSPGSGSGSAVDFSASDEEFQLSPSGVGLDGDIESSSQVIEVEDSEVVADAVEFTDDFSEQNAFADAGFAEAAGGDVFGDAQSEAEATSGAALGEDPMGDEPMAIDDAAPAMPTAAGAVGYEVPFTMLQCLTLMFVLLTLALGGMLMTDLVRNMWAYNESAAPVSALTDALIDLFGLGS